MTHILKYKHNRGFTLIELAIALVIIAVLAGAFLSTLGSRIETTRRVETAKQLETIKQALYGYAMSQTKPHLPCPDCRTTACATVLALSGSKANDGVEDRNITGDCALGNTPGNLPWRTLGLASGDAWADRYTYWVSSGVAKTTGFTLNVTPANEAVIDTRVNGNLTTVSDSAVAVIMSQGKNGYGGESMQNIANPAVPASDVDESDNLDNNRQFVMRPPTKAGTPASNGGEFDDMLVWISEYELKAKMVQAGVLP